MANSSKKNEVPRKSQRGGLSPTTTSFPRAYFQESMAVSEADAIKDLTDEEVEDLKETFRTFDKVRCAVPPPSFLKSVFVRSLQPCRREVCTYSK